MVLLEEPTTCFHSAAAQPLAGSCLSLLLSTKPWCQQLLHWKGRAGLETTRPAVIWVQEGAQKEAASSGASTAAVSSTSVSAAERDSLVPRIQSAKSFANLTERSSTL